MALVFDLKTIVNPLAARPGILILSGHRVVLPGVLSHEPLMRGCDQREWLERLVDLGVRHLVLPLNGREEDTCLFSRRHPDAEPAREVVYDLRYRDEGFFARLQFLLDAAARMGVLVGLSLYSVSRSEMAGPLRPGANLQGIALTETTARDTQTEPLLMTAASWVAAAIRGRNNVWIEVFRGRLLNDDSFARELESKLSRTLADTLGKSKQEPAEESNAANGPWVVFPQGAEAHARSAPFSVWRGAGAHDFLDDAESRRKPAVYRIPARIGTKAKKNSRVLLWRSVMRGCWPIVTGGFESESQAAAWYPLATIASFAKNWVTRSYLRSCPELLGRMPPEAREQFAAATDGCGRYFLYSSGPIKKGLRLETLPGSYRYYWFAPDSGAGIDRGEGVDGGADCRVPGPGKTKESLLILEQEELSDPLSIW